MDVGELDSLSDDELAAVAMGAEADVEVGDDAVSLWELMGSDGPALLPEWYMPAPMGGARPPRTWWRWVAMVIIVSFVAINAYGLCSTYGHVGFG